MTIHYCSQEDITGVFFFVPLSEEPCEHHHKDHSGCHPSPYNKQDHYPGNNCGHALCTSQNEDDPEDPGPLNATDYPECCSDTVLFITLEEDYVKAEPFEIDLPGTLVLFVSYKNLPEEAVNTNTLLASSIKKHPPGQLYGKHLVYLNRQLLL